MVGMPGTIVGTGLTLRGRSGLYCRQRVRGKVCHVADPGPLLRSVRRCTCRLHGGRAAVDWR